jgi:hypothetical protein
MKNKTDYNLYIKGAVALAGLFAGYKILQKFGVFKTSEEKQEGKSLESLESSNYWDYNKFLKTLPAGALLLTQGGATAYANDIYDAKGIFNDDEDKVYSVFRAMKTQGQVAALSKRFNQIYSKDLYTFIRGFFNDDEMLTLKKLLDAKPKYKL